MFIADLVAAGIDPLQDVDREMEIQLRTVRMGCRIQSRDVLGDFIIDDESVGDQMGWVLWKPVRGERPIPAYTQAWPSKVISATSGTGTAMDAFGVVPVSLRMDYDLRWEVKTPSVGRYGPALRRRLWNRSPKGQVGIMLSTPDEYDPQELFMPTDPRLIPVNVAGDGMMGTVAVDLTDDNQYDPSRYARIQTAWRVIPLGTPDPWLAGMVQDPEAESGVNLGAIAWNLALTGREGALGRGLVIDQSSNAVPPPPERTPTETPSGQGSKRFPDTPTK